MLKNLRASLVLCGLFAVPALAAATSTSMSFDRPDLRLELELHRQYLRARGQEADTPVLAKDAYIENYRIQNRETLWSLSKMLYGDGGYWPRVWAQNRSITNPHLVKPGYTLQLLLGSEDDTPAFRFTEDASENSGVELASSSSEPMIEIPPPEIPPRPVLRLPPSFPAWQNVFRPRPRPLLDDRGIKPPPDQIKDKMYLRAWVEEKDLDPVGYFLENDTESGLPVVNQYIFVKVKKGLGHIGQKLLIAHSAGKIRTVNDNFDNNVDAYLVQVAGEIQLTEGVSADWIHGSDRENYDAFRALITRTTGLMLKDNILIPGELQMVDISAKGAQGTTQAQVIGSERNPASMLFGQGDFVFLNKGTKQGLEEGQILDLFADRRSRYPDTPVPVSPAPSGRVKVVKVTDNLATAFILNAHDSVLQGDTVKELSLRAGDTEKYDDIDVKGVDGGEIQSDDGSSAPQDESTLEDELDQGGDGN